MDRGEIRLKNETLAVLDNYMLTRGVPLPPGKVRSAGGVSVVDRRGRALPCEGRVLQRRPDGSIEWLQLDVLTRLGGQEDGVDLHRAAAPGPAAPAVAHPVTVTDQRGLVTLSNGLTTLTLQRAGGSLIRRLVIRGRTVVEEGALVDLQVGDMGGKIYRASVNGPYKVQVTHRNRLRTEVTLTGKHRARDKSTFIDFALRFTLCANSPDLKLEHTFYCREPREGKIPVRFMRLVMPTTMDPGAAKVLRQNTRGADCVCHDLVLRENVEVVASATGDLDHYRDAGGAVVHQSAGGAVFLRNPDSFAENWGEYPFHMRPGQGTSYRNWHASIGMRHVVPIVGWCEKDFSLVTAFEHFRQLHPKSIEIDENVLTWSIWPAWSTPMEGGAGRVQEPHLLAHRRAARPGHRRDHRHAVPVGVRLRRAGGRVVRPGVAGVLPGARLPPAPAVPAREVPAAGEPDRGGAGGGQPGAAHVRPAAGDRHVQLRRHRQRRRDHQLRQQRGRRQRLLPAPSSSCARATRTRGTTARRWPGTTWRWTTASGTRGSGRRAA